MRFRHPTDEELRETFDRLLTSVVSGGGLMTCTGLDMETDGALLAVMRAYPAVTPALVEAAERAFAGQLDGSNAARARARLERMLAELDQRRRAAGE